jgi:hypothetical protein
MSETQYTKPLKQAQQLASQVMDSLPPRDRIEAMNSLQAVSNQMKSEATRLLALIAWIATWKRG